MLCICGLFLCLFIPGLPESACGLILLESGIRDLPESACDLILPESGIRDLPGSAAGLFLNPAYRIFPNLPAALSCPNPAYGIFPDLPQDLSYLYLAISEIACMFSKAIGILSSPPPPPMVSFVTEACRIYSPLLTSTLRSCVTAKST